MQLPSHPLFRVCLGPVVALALTACATPPPPQLAPVELPATWWAPTLPHQGTPQDLTAWWSRFNDPLLADWIAQAQRRSPSVASARAQVFAARAALAGAEQQGRPQMAGVVSGSRAFTDPTTPVATVLSAGAQASWAIALWGEDVSRVSAAQAQQDAAGAGWHEARVLVAAETAQAYFGLRLCREQLAVARADSDSRQRTADANGITEKAGLTAPAVAALARASAAESAGRLAQWGELCERQLKSLTALTGVPEPTLRAGLAQAPRWETPADQLLQVPGVPADLLRQRPDVYRAQRQWVAAAQAVGLAQAALRPSLSLSGNLMVNRVRVAGISATVDTWSLGPLTLSVPLLGRDRLHAEVDAAQAQLDAAAVAYQAVVRQAVSEVEQSLVSLAAVRERVGSAALAVEGYRRSLDGTTSRYQAGLASLNELEDARRWLLAADNAALLLRQEQLAAWVRLYVALGGGFEPSSASDKAQQPIARDAS
ncbi:efflux transporter outer membrane subunit [Hydrogenophaga defluvii]|uniref:Efflux transporter outer membrane subunit n=1 Tax=Hydrogenophaga defluvii TaxID=249410 RepID=A0ABW2S9N9_9BURK